VYDGKHLLKNLQKFDPPGVGARDLKECLLLQVGPFKKDAHLLIRLIEEHLVDLEKRNYAAITKGLGISKDKMAELAAHNIIAALSGKSPKNLIK